MNVLYGFALALIVFAAVLALLSLQGWAWFLVAGVIFGVIAEGAP